MQRLTAQDAEPGFGLVQPGRIGGSEVQLHVRMALQPAVLFRPCACSSCPSTTWISRFGLAAAISFIKSRNSRRRRRLQCAVLTCPVATSSAANKVVVP